MRMFRRRPTGTTGATAVEYALILAGSVFGLFAIVVGLKGAMANAIGNASDSQAVLSDGSTATPSNGPTSVVPPPAAPSVSSVPKNGAADISWGAVNGATSYVVSCPGGPVTVNAPSLTATCAGLTNGTQYTIGVVAKGNSGSSTAGTTTVTPRTVPGAPTALTADPANGGGVTIGWTAPASNGGAPITGYTVTNVPAGGSCNVSGTTATCTGLTAGTNYTFSVVATNDAGNGAAATVQEQAPSPVSRVSTVSENFAAPNNYRSYTCTVSPASAGACSYTTTGTDRVTFDPTNTAAVGTPVTVTWTFLDRNNNTLTTLTRTYYLTA